MDADTRRMLIAMLEESSRLGRMIDRLLLIARADQTRMTPSLVPRTLAPIAEDIISLMQVLAEENNLHLGLEGDLTRRAVVDEDCMRQVLIDLLDNALRYANSRVVIRIAGEGHCTRVDVDDDGPGIPEEKRSRMLQRFARDDESRTRTPLHADGFGLGLAIASALTELQKGTLELADTSSADGSSPRGLSVRLRFPATRQA
jgi:signal transduction histidine kinase